MVATFCLRLAFGMIAPLLLLDPRPIPPRFFRVQYLAALGLVTIAGIFFPADLTRVALLLLLFICSGFLCLAGSVIWHVDDAPGGKPMNCAATASLAITLFLLQPPVALSNQDWAEVADQFASAGLLGASLSAMLLGHAYLISPGMTIVPLQRLIALMGIALLGRILLAAVGLWQWTSEHPLGNLETETILWLSARWLLGIFAPIGLGWMAWETARIRSTQSATGILYVVVIVVFLGELTSLLLLEKTGSIL
jgi:hypothetical protein